MTHSEGSKLAIELYADDIWMYRPIRTNEDYCALQRDVAMISEWANNYKLTAVSAVPRANLCWYQGPEK